MSSFAVILQRETFAYCFRCSMSCALHFATLKQVIQLLDFYNFIILLCAFLSLS